MTRTLAGFAIASTVAVCACGMASSAAGPPVPGPDAAILDPDGSVPVDLDGGTSPPRLVVVNGITEAKGAFDGVVICIGKGTAQPRTIMPLTNYAGIPVGGGADFGGKLIGKITLDVFDAASAANQSDCGSLTNGQAHASIPVDVKTVGTTVVTLVTDAAKPMKLGSRVIQYNGDSPSKPGYVTAHFANLSAVSGGVKLSIEGQPMADLLSNTEVSARFEVKYGPQVELLVESSTGNVTQRLESVQYASDPTSTPDAYFGVRASFLFALVGDPQVGFDASAPAKDLTGRELHLVAVRYGDGLP